MCFILHLSYVIKSQFKLTTKQTHKLTILSRYAAGLSVSGGSRYFYPFKMVIGTS